MIDKITTEEAITSVFLVRESSGAIALRRRDFRTIDEVLLHVNISTINEPRLEKIERALRDEDFCGAAIYLAQMSPLTSILDLNSRDLPHNIVKGFNPDEPRDDRGRWTGSEKPQPIPAIYPSPVDPTCALHKVRCRAECYGTLPTRDGGFSFHNCVNGCMDAVGCLGRA